MQPDPTEAFERHRVAFEAAPVGIAFVALVPELRFIESNAAMREILGASEDELRAGGPLDFVHPADRRLQLTGAQRLMAGEIDDYRVEVRYVRRDQRIGWVSAYVTLVRDSSGAPALIVSLVEDITEKHWMREIHDRLIGLVLDGHGEKALGELAELIECPVALVDVFGHRLGEGRLAGRGVEVPPKAQLEEAGARADPGLTVLPLMLGGRVEGYLVAGGVPTVGSMTGPAIEQAASTFAVELAMIRNAEQVEQRLRGDLFDAIMSDSPPSSTSLIRWGRRLGQDLASIVEIAIVRPLASAEDSETLELSRLTRWIAVIARELAPGSVALTRGDGVLVALAAGRGDAGLGHATTSRLVERLKLDTGIATVAGVSRGVTGPGDLAEAIRDARQAVDAAYMLPRLGAVVAYDDLNLRHLILGREAPDEIVRAARRTLSPLLAPADLRNRDALVATLATYLQAVGNLKTSARRLGVHINTMRRRVERLEEVLGLDLQDARNRVDLQLALEVLQLYDVPSMLTQIAP